MTMNPADRPAPPPVPAPFGYIYFSLQYVPAGKGHLTVKIEEAKGLIAKDTNGLSDPYVKIELLNKGETVKEFKTSVKKGKLNPCWMESFTFEDVPYKEMKHTEILLTVMDYDKIGLNDGMGKVLLGSKATGRELKHWEDMLNDSKHAALQWHTLCNPDENLDEIKEEHKMGDAGAQEAPKETSEFGQIHISLRYIPTSGKLTVTIEEAKALKAMDANGLSDPFVKIDLLENGKKKKDKKTEVKKATLNPHYKESFTFEVPSKEMKHAGLLITVFDYDKFGANDAMGKITLSGAAMGKALKHWEDMLDDSRKAVSEWHNLHDPDEE